MSIAYWITNVRLDRGYVYEGTRVAATKSELVHIRVNEGKFVEYVPADHALHTELPIINANGFLMLPTFQDMHIHIDKTYYGGPWKAPTPIRNIFTRLDEEKELLPKLLPTARERAEKMLGLFLKNGTTHVRTHCNVDPVIGLKNLEATIQALETYKGKVTGEIVAFPQHGLLRSNSVRLIREAMRMGANLVGGVDPATVDENIEMSLQNIMEIAVEFDAGIDIHIHDRGHLGAFTFQRLAAITEDAGWHGRVTISHAIGLADLPLQEQQELAERFHELGISITTTVPIDRPTIPIPLLYAAGVKVSLGEDSITDHWSPFGQGDVLAKVNVMAERFRIYDEYMLSQSLGFITGGQTTLDRNGERSWPQLGADATAVFVDASCSAETVGRASERKAVLVAGKIVAGALN